MRTLLAPGPGPGGRPQAGSPLRVLAGATCAAGAARLIFARIDPAAAQGAYAAGSVDGLGMPLHLAYTIQGEDAVPHTTYPGVVHLQRTNETTVEFGPGMHYLNHPGELTLIGGNGLWTVDIQVVPVTERHLHWHYLMQFIAIRNMFSPPNGHSMVGTLNPGSTLTMFNGATIVAGAPPVPAFGPIAVGTTGSSDSSLWVYSAWYG